jgi:methylthioribose-1-phosphate isomerase
LLKRRRGRRKYLREFFTLKKSGELMVSPALRWVGDVNGHLELLDQRRLPGEVVKIKCETVEQLYEAIKTLAVRGAPAIGVAAGYGVVLSLRSTEDKNLGSAIGCVERTCERLGSARPTAVNLFAALERCKKAAKKFVESQSGASVEALRECVLRTAQSIYEEDVEMCRRIGQNGQKFIKDGGAVLTHCNAGALATAGQGTALSVLYEAKNNGKKFVVYVDETRPLLQGARLTAWELQQAGIETILICDNMAGALMKQGRIDAVITGADRIAANGDTANKIGTYSLAVLAKQNKVPFYVAAPSSTFDLSISSGDAIPIEQRDTAEVECFAGKKVAPAGVSVYNPAFDVTEAELITAIITEKGLIERPDSDKIRKIFEITG